MRALVKSCISHASSKPSSPRGRGSAAAGLRQNNSEAKDYVYHIRAGNILGVDPGEVYQCPVCFKFLEEVFNRKLKHIKVDPRAHSEEIATDRKEMAGHFGHNEFGCIGSIALIEFDD